MVGCANKSDQVIPPVVIYDAVRLKRVWAKDEMPGTKYGLDGGGLTRELFPPFWSLIQSVFF